MENISPLHVQQHALLSPLSHNFKLFPYFFPSYETCSINVNSAFHAAIKNLHVKANGIFVFLHLHPPLFTTTISEGITHARKNTFLRQKQKQTFYSLNTLSLPSFQGPLWPGVVAPERCLTFKLRANKWHAKLNCFNRTVWSFNCVQTNDWCLIELLARHSNNWNHLTVCKWMNNVE